MPTVSRIVGAGAVCQEVRIIIAVNVVAEQPRAGWSADIGLEWAWIIGVVAVVGPDQRIGYVVQVDQRHGLEFRARYRQPDDRRSNVHPRAHVLAFFAKRGELPAKRHRDQPRGDSEESEKVVRRSAA